MTTEFSLPLKVPGADRQLGGEINPTFIPEDDAQLALEIAEFVADRAQAFDDHECRAWALTDFGVWAALAGRYPRLALEREPSSFDDDGSAP